MNPVDVLNQIKRLTTDVIAVGICDEQNFPSIKSYTGSSIRGLLFYTNPVLLQVFSILLQNCGRRLFFLI